jgi:hypothetical protein
MLTTTDNPFDPFTEFDAWYTWDASAGYHTPSYLARIVRSSDELSEADQNAANEQGIDEIVNLNLLGIYKKVSREVPDAAPNA